jgi:hypothetical protein
VTAEAHLPYGDSAIEYSKVLEPAEVKGVAEPSAVNKANNFVGRDLEINIIPGGPSTIPLLKG